MSEWTSTSRSHVIDQVELAARLTLRAVPGLRDRAINRLIAQHGSAGAALRQPQDMLGLGARTLPDARIERVVREYLRAIQRHDITVLTPDGPGYPQRLLQHLDVATPALLFAIGDTSLLQEIGVAVVGSRAMSEYGRTVTEDFTRGLSNAGFTIISGLALGIDGVAHNAALDACGATIAVVGNGVDVIYPPANRMLRQRIIEHGLLLSQFPPGERPAPHHFPERNLILAALSTGVLVVEAGARSGASITVNHAGDLGIGTMAVPGPVGRPTSIGSNDLIRNGVTCVTCVDEIIEHIDWPEREVELAAQRARNIERWAAHAAARAADRAVNCAADRATDHAPGAAARGAFCDDGAESGIDMDDFDTDTHEPSFHVIRAALNVEPRHLDDIVMSTQLPAHLVVAALQELEIAGIARQHPGARYELRT